MVVAMVSRVIGGSDDSVGFRRQSGEWVACQNSIGNRKDER